MTTEQALLAAIWESPHDDLPRLVYADWLDETGDTAKAARAEFIRVQCELARVGGWDDRTEALQDAERHLVIEWRTEWIPSRPLWYSNAAFYRGFYCPDFGGELRTFRTELPRARTVAPLYDLSLSQPHWFVEFLTQPTAQGMQSLRLSDQFILWGRLLADSEPVRNLRTLSVDSPYIHLDDFRLFCRATHLVHLSELSLPRCETTADVSDQIVNAPFAPQLRRLALGGRGPTPSGVLARPLVSAALSRLEEYSVYAPDAHYNWSELFRSLAEEGTGMGLKCLGVYGGWVSEAGCLDLLGWPGRVTLRALHLETGLAPATANGLRVETLISLLESGDLPHLRTLTARPCNYDRRASEDPGGRLAKLRQLAHDRGVKLELW